MTDERPHESIEELLITRERTEEERERDLRIAQRAEVLNHVDYLIRPPASFYEFLEEAIRLGAEGRYDEEIQGDRRRVPVKDVIESWELEELVERAREGTWGDAASRTW